MENDRLEHASAAAGKFLAKRQLAQIDATLSIMIDRVRAATPKGAKPSDSGTIDALRTEAGLRGDVTLVHYPRPTPSLSGLVRLPGVPQLEAGLALADWLELAGLDGILPALGPLLEAGSGEPMAHLPWLEL